VAAFEMAVKDRTAFDAAFGSFITGLLHFGISRSIVPAVQLASARWGVASMALSA
jgi:hypothetical protein